MSRKPTNPYYHPEENARNRHTAERPSPYAEQRYQAATPPPRRKKKKSGGKRIATVLLVIALVCGGVYLGLNRLVTGGGGQLPDAIGTPEEIRDDVVNILCAGIDYEEGRDYNDGMGMTDVILYVSYNVKENKINMLQIPRDTYVGETVSTGNTGKINAVARFGEQKPEIANLAQVLNDQLRLPVDYYITIDMDAFKTVINAIGGLEVTIPFDITDDFGNTLSAGTQTIDGATAEFMVRQRHNYGNADLGRLEMQRYMYSALLKTFKSFPVKDILKVMPAYIQYVKTDISLA
ncbi:MAG: LCP family protein, partial [Pygmaiobacter sp.]